MLTVYHIDQIRLQDSSQMENQQSRCRSPCAQPRKASQRLQLSLIVHLFAFYSICHQICGTNPCLVSMQAFLEFCYGTMYNLIMGLATCITCIIFSLYEVLSLYMLLPSIASLFVTNGRDVGEHPPTSGLTNPNIKRRSPPIISQHGAVIQLAVVSWYP